ncbi:uncharacterized protein LOC135837338 [Planococcus citri]|uniref:uncharacterized protein LOC135837338 n=1 Tax=Planococcus citri TaxID=170843 RepID=UPI0031F9C3F7
MNTRFKTFLFVLLVIKAIISTRAQAPLSYDNDVTKHLDGWVGKLLKTGTDTFKKLFSKISTLTLKDFNFDISKEIYPLGNRFQFRDVYMNVSEFKAPQLHWKFSESKMSVYVKEFTVRVFGSILRPSSMPYTGFETHLDLENVSFTLAITPEDKTSISFTQDKSWLWYNGERNWEVRFHTSDDNDSPENRRRELEEELLPAATALLRENFNQNEQFSKNIRTIFGVYSESREKLLQTHSDFFTNQEKYYYLIPKIPFFCFNLKNILIKGLTNLEWIKINTGLSIFTHTLMIRNVHGDLILDFGATQEKPVELKFKIDYFSVSTDRKSVNVDARCFSVNKTSTPLSYRQSALIIQRIESAIADSLFPTLQLRRTYDIDTPLEEIKITDKTDWKSIKQSFREWIPFNEDDTKPPAGGQVKS